MGIDLAEFRRGVGKSQHDVADEAGVSQPTVSRLEAQVCHPTAIVMLNIQDWADALARKRRIPKAEWLCWDWIRAA